MPMMSQTQLLYLFVALSLFAIPSALILKKLGRSPGWALLCFIPALAMIGLWVMAFSLPNRSDAA